MRGFDVNLLKVSFHITGVNNLATKQWGYTPQMLADRLQRDLSAGNVTQTFDLGMGAVRPVAVSLGQPTEPTKPTPEPTKPTPEPTKPTKPTPEPTKPTPEPTKPTEPTETTEPNVSSSTGVTVGAAVGLFFLGMLVSALALLTVCGVIVFCKRRSTQGSFDINKNAAVDYERQNDNVALSPTEDKI